MKKYVILLTVLVIFTVLACSTESLVGPNNDLLVIQAYVFANEPVNDIRITSTLPLGVEDASPTPINDASVSISKNGNIFMLKSSPGDSGYYHYDGSDFSIEAGDDLILTVTYLGVTATGETTVPAAPENLSLSSDVVVYPEFSFGGGGPGNRQGFLGNFQMSVRWKKETNAFYYVKIDNIDANPEPVDFNFPFLSNFEIISRPTANDSFQVNLFTFTQLGKHRVKVFRVNREYADLFLTSSQDSRDLNEPLTNIENGLGIFSAFNSDSLFFELIRQ